MENKEQELSQKEGKDRSPAVSEDSSSERSDEESPGRHRFSFNSDEFELIQITESCDEAAPYGSTSEPSTQVIPKNEQNPISSSAKPADLDTSTICPDFEIVSLECEPKRHLSSFANTDHNIGETSLEAARGEEDVDKLWANPINVEASAELDNSQLNSKPETANVCGSIIESENPKPEEFRCVETSEDTKQIAIGQFESCDPRDQESDTQTGAEADYVIIEEPVDDFFQSDLSAAKRIVEQVCQSEIESDQLHPEISEQLESFSQMAANQQGTTNQQTDDNLDLDNISVSTNQEAASDIPDDDSTTLEEDSDSGDYDTQETRLEPNYQDNITQPTLHKTLSVVPEENSDPGSEIDETEGDTKSETVDSVDHKHQSDVVGSGYVQTVPMAIGSDSEIYATDSDSAGEASETLTSLMLTETESIPNTDQNEKNVPEDTSAQDESKSIDGEGTINSQDLENTPGETDPDFDISDTGISYNTDEAIKEVQKIEQPKSTVDETVDKTPPLKADDETKPVENVTVEQVTESMTFLKDDVNQAQPVENVSQLRPNVYETENTDDTTQHIAVTPRSDTDALYNVAVEHEERGDERTPNTEVLDETFDSETVEEKSGVDALSEKSYNSSEWDVRSDKSYEDVLQEAVQTLKGDHEPRRKSRGRRHRHGDEKRARSNSAKRHYDWNSSHFFPDIHDTDDLKPRPQITPRQSRYNDFIEEEWVRDQIEQDLKRKRAEEEAENQPRKTENNDGNKNAVAVDTARHSNGSQENELIKETGSSKLDSTYGVLSDKENEAPNVKKIQADYEKRRPFGPDIIQANAQGTAQKHLAEEEGSLSSDPEDGPKVWKKSPLHVNRRKRKDRPSSQEIRLNISSSETTQETSEQNPPPSPRSGIKMGSPSVQRRNRETSPFTRNPRRQSAPLMGTKSVKKQPPAASEEIQEKYDKFAELQRRRKALESTSDESLQIIQQTSIQDSLRRYQKHSRQHGALIHNRTEKSASRKLFKGDDETQKEIFITEPAYTAATQQGNTSDENTNDFLMQMKQRLRSVNKDQADEKSGDKNATFANRIPLENKTAFTPDKNNTRAQVQPTNAPFENLQNLKITNISQSRVYMQKSKVNNNNVSSSPRGKRREAQVEIFPFTENIIQKQRNPSGKSDTRSTTDTPTSQLSEKSGLSPRSLDAKSLIQEEKKKFEEYKREYARRHSSKDSSGEELSSNECRSPVQKREIPPDEYEYVLRKIHHTRQTAIVDGKRPGGLVKEEKKRESGDSVPEFMMHPVQTGRYLDKKQKSQGQYNGSYWLDSDTYLQTQQHKLRQRQNSSSDHDETFMSPTQKQPHTSYHDNYYYSSNHRPAHYSFQDDTYSPPTQKSAPTNYREETHSLPSQNQSSSYHDDTYAPPINDNTVPAYRDDSMTSPVHQRNPPWYRDETYDPTNQRRTPSYHGDSYESQVHPGSGYRNITPTSPAHGRYPSDYYDPDKTAQLDAYEPRRPIGPDQSRAYTAPNQTNQNRSQALPYEQYNFEMRRGVGNAQIEADFNNTYYAKVQPDNKIYYNRQPDYGRYPDQHHSHPSQVCAPDTAYTQGYPQYNRYGQEDRPHSSQSNVEMSYRDMYGSRERNPEIHSGKKQAPQKPLRSALKSQSLPYIADDLVPTRYEQYDYKPERSRDTVRDYIQPSPSMPLRNDAHYLSPKSSPRTPARQPVLIWNTGYQAESPPPIRQDTHPDTRMNRGPAEDLDLPPPPPELLAPPESEDPYYRLPPHEPEKKWGPEVVFDRIAYGDSIPDLDRSTWSAPPDLSQRSDNYAPHYFQYRNYPSNNQTRGYYGNYEQLPVDPQSPRVRLLSPPTYTSSHHPSDKPRNYQPLEQGGQDYIADSNQYVERRDAASPRDRDRYVREYIPDYRDAAPHRKPSSFARAALNRAQQGGNILAQTADAPVTSAHLYEHPQSSRDFYGNDLTGGAPAFRTSQSQESLPRDNEPNVTSIPPHNHSAQLYEQPRDHHMTSRGHARSISPKSDRSGKREERGRGRSETKKTYTQIYPPPPDATVFEFSPAEQKVFAQQLEDKLTYLKKTDPLRYSTYEDKVNRYVNAHKQSTATNQYEAYVQRGRDKYRAKHETDLSPKKHQDYVDIEFIRQRKGGINKATQRSKSLPREANEAKKKSNFGRQAKTTQSFRQSPERSLASNAGYKSTIRPARSAENLVNTKDDIPTGCVSSIKERLFGPGGETYGVIPTKQIIDPVFANRNTKPISSIKTEVFNKTDHVPPKAEPTHIRSASYLSDDRDQRIYDYVSYKDGQKRKRSQIKDELTDLEYTYDKLNLDDDNIFTGADNHDFNIPPGLVESDEPNIKRLSITNVKKFEEMLQRHVEGTENPGLNYAKKWLSSDTSDKSSTNEPVCVRHKAADSHVASGQSYAGSRTSIDRPESSLPRRITDDMAYRKVHPIPPIHPSQNAPTGSYITRSGKSTSATSIRSDEPARRTFYNVPDPVYDDVVNRSLRRSRSPEKRDQPKLLPSNTTTDYLKERKSEPARAQLRMNPDSHFDKYHDDMAYRKLRRDASPVKVDIPSCYYENKANQPTLKSRSRSLERGSARQQQQQRRSIPIRRSSSFERNEPRDLPRLPKNMDKGVAKMVSRFTGCKELSQSAPNLNEETIFENNYNAFGDLVSTDPKFKYAQKPKKKETPRIVKQRSEFKSKFKSKSGDSGFCAESGESDVSHSSSTDNTSHRTQSASCITPDGAYESDEIELNMKPRQKRESSNANNNNKSDSRNRFFQERFTTETATNIHAPPQQQQSAKGQKDYSKLQFIDDSPNNGQAYPNAQILRPSSIDLKSQSNKGDIHIISIHKSPSPTRAKFQFQLKREMLRQPEPRRETSQNKLEVKLSKPRTFTTSPKDKSPTYDAKEIQEKILSKAFTAPPPRSDMRDFDARLRNAKNKLTSELAPRVSRASVQSRPKSMDVSFSSEKKSPVQVSKGQTLEFNVRISPQFSSNVNKAELQAGLASNVKSTYTWSQEQQKFVQHGEQKPVQMHSISTFSKSEVTSPRSLTSASGESLTPRQPETREVKIIRIGGTDTSQTKPRNVAKVEPQSMVSHARQRSYDLSDGELTDATDITIDSIVRANIPSSTFSPIQPKETTPSLEKLTPLKVAPIKVAPFGSMDTVETLHGNDSVTTVQDSEHTKSNYSMSYSEKSVKSHSSFEAVSTSVRTSQRETVDISSVVLRKKESSQYKREEKKEIKEERRLSLKDRVKMFEDQADPLMRGPRVNEDGM